MLSVSTLSKSVAASRVVNPVSHPSPPADKALLIMRATSDLLLAIGARSTLNHAFAVTARWLFEIGSAQLIVVFKTSGIAVPVCVAETAWCIEGAWDAVAASLWLAAEIALVVFVVIGIFGRHCGLVVCLVAWWGFGDVLLCRASWPWLVVEGVVEFLLLPFLRSAYFGLLWIGDGRKVKKVSSVALYMLNILDVEAPRYSPSCLAVYVAKSIVGE